MFSTNITLQPDILTLSGGTVYAAMYGQLLSAYTPSSGPSNGVNLPALSWVYFTGSDYAATTAGANVSSFATYTASGLQTITFPSVCIQSAHIVFGLGTLPAITADPTGAPQQPDPVGLGSIYDFVEFTYDLTNTLYLNTTMIDQFGFPIQIQLDPATPVLPNGAGVIMERGDVFSNYATYMAGSANSAYLQCVNDAFGNPMTQRILSPKNAVLGNGVAGTVVTIITGNPPPTSTLPAGTYYYAVTALNANGDASYAQYNVLGLTVAANTPVNIAWSPNSFQPAGTNSYNVYRGSFSGTELSWVCIGNVPASTFPSGAGGALADLGQAAVSGQPDVEFNPLVSAFDSEITTFFETYLSTNPKPVSLTLTATDGTSNGYVYTFTGNSVYASGTTNISALQLSLVGVVDSSGKTVSSPPVPLQTLFNIYYPFWNTNTFNLNNPAPPSWTVYPNDTPSVMVLAAQGVFADNAAQPVPSGVTNATIYGVLLGALENQIVAAITRGIANLPGNPQNWGNGTAPTQTAPALTAGTSTLKINTPYYYIITAVNANGETYGSFEFTATPLAATPSVQLNWLPFSTTQASSFNIYRGTASLQENVLVTSVTNDGKVSSYTDTGAAGTTQSPPMYFPAGVPSSAYDAFFHQTNVSINGAAYAGPYDDQGGQSSTISMASPSSMSISLGIQPVDLSMSAGLVASAAGR